MSILAMPAGSCRGSIGGNAEFCRSVVAKIRQRRSAPLSSSRHTLPAGRRRYYGHGGSVARSASSAGPEQAAPVGILKNGFVDYYEILQVVRRGGVYTPRLISRQSPASLPNNFDDYPSDARQRLFPIFSPFGYRCAPPPPPRSRRLTTMPAPRRSRRPTGPRPKSATRTSLAERATTFAFC